MPVGDSDRRHAQPVFGAEDEAEPVAIADPAWLRMHGEFLAARPVLVVRRQRMDAAPRGVIRSTRVLPPGNDLNAIRHGCQVAGSWSFGRREVEPDTAWHAPPALQPMGGLRRNQLRAVGKHGRCQPGKDERQLISGGHRFSRRHVGPDRPPKCGRGPWHHHRHQRPATAKADAVAGAAGRCPRLKGVERHRGGGATQGDADARPR